MKSCNIDNLLTFIYVNMFCWHCILMQFKLSHSQVMLVPKCKTRFVICIIIYLSSLNILINVSTLWLWANVDVIMANYAFIYFSILSPKIKKFKDPFALDFNFASMFKAGRREKLGAKGNCVARTNYSCNYWGIDSDYSVFIKIRWDISLKTFTSTKYIANIPVDWDQSCIKPRYLWKNYCELKSEWSLNI